MKSFKLLASGASFPLLLAVLAAPAHAGDIPPPDNSAAITAGTADTGKPNAVAIAIEGGHYDAARSVRSAVRSGSFAASLAKGVTIASSANDLDGVRASGQGQAFTLTGAQIDVSGNLGPSLSGPTGAIVTDGATLILRNAKITTNGLVSAATTAQKGGILKVYDSELRANGGKIPDGYVAHMGPGSVEPPAPLGIKGTSRTHLAVTHSRSYFYRSKIIAQGWGALSTDMSDNFVYLQADDCDIQAIESGYGLYADVGAEVIVNRSRVSAATYGAILASRASLVFTDTQLTSRGNVAMIHNIDLPPGQGNAFWGGRLDFYGGTYASTGTAILVKSANVDIVIDRAQVSGGNGQLIRAIANDDPFSARTNGQPVSGIKVRIADTQLSGDLVNEDPDRMLQATLARATLKGALQKVDLVLDGASRWTATANSRVHFGAAVDVGQIDAARGVTIQADVGESGLTPGTYPLTGGGTLSIEG